MWLGLETCDASLCLVGALQYAATHDKFLGSFIFRFPHDKLHFICMTGKRPFSCSCCISITDFCVMPDKHDKLAFIFQTQTYLHLIGSAYLCGGCRTILCERGLRRMTTHNSPSPSFLSHERQHKQRQKWNFRMTNTHIWTVVLFWIIIPKFVMQTVLQRKWWKKWYFALQMRKRGSCAHSHKTSSSPKPDKTSASGKAWSIFSPSVLAEEDAAPCCCVSVVFDILGFFNLLFLGLFIDVLLFTRRNSSLL